MEDRSEVEMQELTGFSHWQVATCGALLYRAVLAEKMELDEHTESFMRRVGCSNNGVQHCTVSLQLHR